MPDPAFFQPWTFPRLDRNRRVSVLVWGYLAFSAGYLLLGRYPLRTPITLIPSPLDAAIPFLPLSLLAYLSHYPFLLLCLWRHPDPDLRSRAFYAMVLASLAAFAVFLALPTQVIRPLPQEAGWLSPAWEALFRIDTPANCFPSLHAALSAIALLSVLASRWSFRVAALPWALAIWASTLTTKQHLTLDLAGGLVLGGLAWWIVSRRVRFS